MIATGTQVFTRWLVPMLALAIFIHALDRGNFATAAPLIKDDLVLSNPQIGTGDYRVTFLFAAAIAVAGMLFWGVMIRKIAPLDWDRKHA